MARILVAGGTGKVGSQVVRGLSAAGADVLVLTREPMGEKALRLAGLPGVSFMQGDFSSSASLSPAFLGVGAAFIGMSNSEQQVAIEKNLIDAAAASVSCRYVVKLGTVGLFTDSESAVQYGRDHAAIEEHLDGSPLAWTVLRPNWFMQNQVADIFGTLPLGLVVYPVPGDVEFTPVDARDVGDLAAALLLLPPEERLRHDHQLYDVCGPESMTFERLAELYSSALGREVKAVKNTTEEWVECAKRAGFPPWLAQAVGTSLSDYMAWGLLNYDSSDAALHVRAPCRTMEEWVAEHAPLSPPPAAAAGP